jgi:hypothetical protein
MNENIESFSAELRAKLDGLDKRLKDLTASAKGVTEKAKVEAKAQLAALESRAKEQHAKVQSAEAKTRAWLEEKKAATSKNIAAWKAQHDVTKLAAYAHSTAQYALASMRLAAASVDEAERAALEAVIARMDADAAQEASPIKSA